MPPPTNLKEVFLQPGDHFVGDAEYQIRTMLGSCVSITLWHPARRFGAMSHFLLSSQARGNDPSRQLDGRYAEDAMALMLQQLERENVAPSQCVAKIFGGGDMFPSQNRGGMRNIGLANGEAARALLRAHGIPVVSESLFGSGHRQIIFDISNGNVWERHRKLADESAAKSDDRMLASV